LKCFHHLVLHSCALIRSPHSAGFVLDLESATRPG
jgi:hypothetical protein